MADSPIDYLTLADLCERWHVKQPQIAAVALEGKLTLSIPVPGVHAEFGYYEEYGPNDWNRIPERHEFLRGVFNLSPRDAWNLLREGTKEIDSLAAEEKGGYIDLQPTSHQNGFVAVVGDVLVRRDEVERFETENSPSRAVPAEPIVRGGPGVPPKYDWDGFWVEACRRIHDDGIPATQAAFVREMQDWFDAQGATAPDQSTIKKKISRLWKALGARVEPKGGREEKAQTPMGV